MKKCYLVLIAIIIAPMVHCQYGPQQIISTNADLAFRAMPFDMDNDGFIDVVSASYGDGKIAWYRNEDGLGNFGSEIIIGSSPVMEGMEMVDMDGDNDMDVIYKTNLDKIAWLENLDGQGNFGPERIVNDTSYPYNMATGDIDNDGDMDVLGIIFNEGLMWYENVDGLGNFAPGVQLGSYFYDRHLNLFDLDADGDNDIVLSLEEGNSRLVWFENDGSGNFTVEQLIHQFSISSDFTVIMNVTPSDINGDGKIDLVLDTDNDELPDYIYWMEHLDGEGSFSEPQVIEIKPTTLGSLRTYDLDGDLDMDIVVSYYYNGNSLAWFENLDGQGTFSERHFITTAVVRGTDATAADLNGDGDLDIISASSFDDKIAWYEYLEPLGVTDNDYSRITIYPNPTNGRVLIESSESISEVHLFNSLGQKIKVLMDASELDLSGVESGFYFLKIVGETGYSEVHKILKN